MAEPFFLVLQKKEVPIVLINGRISDKSFSRYKKIKFLIAPILKRVSKFSMQSSIDLERIVSMGADSGNVEVVGNLKFETAASINMEASTSKLTNTYQYFIAGSTHPKEEELLCGVYQKLLQDFPDLRLVIVPRHVERTEEVVSLLGSLDFNTVLYSEYKKDDEILGDSIIVVDSIGQLRLLYASATVVFIGKTLHGQGGQNMIEPAAFARPVIVGPNTQNFRDVMELFLREKAIIQVKDEAELYEQAKALMKDAVLRDQIGKRAQDVVINAQGAKDRTMEIVEEYL